MRFANSAMGSGLSQHEFLEWNFTNQMIEIFDIFLIICVTMETEVTKAVKKEK